MIQLIKSFIANKGNNFSQFYCNSNNPVGHLKEQTKAVPDRAGVYLVFSKTNSELCENCEHLKYALEGESNELFYFGKAGGITKKNRIIRQGLNGRIDNVISDSSRKLKNIKRANYWNIIMNDLNLNKFTIIYFENNNPQDIENTIYNFLDENNRKYPLLNKRRGR